MLGGQEAAEDGGELLRTSCPRETSQTRLAAVLDDRGPSIHPLRLSIPRTISRFSVSHSSKASNLDGRVCSAYYRSVLSRLLVSVHDVTLAPDRPVGT